MFVCPLDILVLISCYRLPITVPSRLAHGQCDVSLLSGCDVVYLPPYYVGVTQYIFPLGPLSRCEGMRSSAAPSENTTDLLLFLLAQNFIF